MGQKYYDLTSSQQVLLFSQKYTLQKQVNNICISVLVDEILDFDILKEAINKTYERYDCLGIRIVKVAKEVKQYFKKNEKPIFEYLDFTGKTYEKMEKKLYKIARKRISKYDKPLSKIYLLNSYDGRTGIYFTVSHFIMDSWAISMFFKDIFTIYQALIEGTELPKPIPSYEELIIDESNYKATEKYIKDRKYFEDLFNNTEEPIFSHINGPEILEKYRKKKKNPKLRHARTFTLKTKADNRSLPFSKDLVEKMEAYCKENRFPMQTLILLAFRSYLSKVNNNESLVTHNTVVAMRGTLREKTAGGSRVQFFPFSTDIKDTTTFEEGCKIISDKQIEMFRHMSIDPLEIISLWKSIYNASQLEEYATTSLTFQPVRLGLDNGMHIESKWYGNGSSGLTLYLLVMDGDGSGELKFYYEYQTAIISFETIKSLHNFMINFIEKGVRDKDLTIVELLNKPPLPDSLKSVK